ncbi:SDR family NAD(P)-dependent oxidoreductase [Arthrobacter sp. HMWF013]|uniref:SDR family NAD(P)-dependent oxidoreductase n=1 Tax=Arthrobacter sp. HMWF013 TaxID=2056849 RepID=UPI000D3BB02C|nr:SDR family NAD(P)-dependent oxidoreductase [Arthrobacter sp. HMWF013]PTT58875.1 oxidoreductase [Arthrobacter sp. HMWF013]
MSQDLSGRTVVVAGSTSAAGVAVVHALSQAGARVAAVDILEDRVQELAVAYNNVTGYVCNLADLQAVEDLATSVQADLGPVDGLIHLVGGWRGGTGIADQTDEDWDFLHTSVLTTLRNTSRAFYDDLAASPAGRLAVVSAQSASTPTAGGAAYAAVKSAAEAWTLAVADGFRNLQGGHESPSAQHSAALVFVVKALVDDRMRAAQPERKFPGYTDVSVLADAVQRIFDLEAEQINGQRLPLTAGHLAGAPA